MLEKKNGAIMKERTLPNAVNELATKICPQILLLELTIMVIHKL